MAGEIRVESHPPERRRRSTTLLAHGCCCCCCLHMVGGIAGSIFGSVSRFPRTPETLSDDTAVRNSEEIRAAHRLAVKAYWLALSLLALIAAGFMTLLGSEGPGVSLFLIVFFLPGGQLLASGATFVYIQARPPARKSECLSRLGRITLFGFLGTVVGCVGLVITFLTLGY